jgi:polyhydroxyalkanoate synthesis regulator phasin
MSIALHARIKELEENLKELADALTATQAQLQVCAIAEVAALKERIQALENRPKPGRPPKNG